MWSRNFLWKHVEMRDVAMDVVKAYYVKEKRIWKLRVLWWNIGACHKPWPMGVEQRLEIPEERRREWQRMGFQEYRK